MPNFKEPERFWSKVDVGEVDECWEWLAFKMPCGYGQFGIHSRMWLTHRVAWVLTFGPIPVGLCVLHKCDNPSCCNPYHLFLGTQSDNLVDAARKGRHGAVKLTRNDVLDIRRLYTSGGWTHRELAAEFGVCRPTISKIISKKRWNWLEEEKIC